MKFSKRLYRDQIKILNGITAATTNSQIFSKLPILPFQAPELTNVEAPLLLLLRRVLPRAGSSCSDAQNRLRVVVVIAVLQRLSELTGLNRRNRRLAHRRFFSSDSPEMEGTKVLALPLTLRPLFPGFYMPLYVKDPKLLTALQENRKHQAPYCGAFLLKDGPGSDTLATETEKSVHDIKGKELYNRLHEVGTLAQITSIQADQVILIGHRHLRTTEMVSMDPLTVKVDHLKDNPYDKDDDVIRASSFEVISTLRDVLKKSSLWRDHVQTYTQHIGDFSFPRVADFGAAISGRNKVQCQAVLEELDACGISLLEYKCLKLSLKLVKKELEISKIQESIAKAIEERLVASSAAPQLYSMNNFRP
ncbi:hypothetical protein Ddye_026213 [Dipteronia dyeriana]|uniref:Lon N-terminal domain-containing protein n=1 Tax=Dipteronia dyeriana TaxID=168575 RepID=A0AAD9WQA0_9ROSI|nr:hypothetical protein Ddye_026213 [Dipteronia dyeriana]